MRVSSIAALAAAVAIASASNAAAQNINVDCTLLVPPNPLTAQGLATPYQLAGLVGAATPGNCNMANAVQSSFVQGAVIDSVTGVIGIYNPLVIDKGTTPAAPPVVPTLNAFSVVGLWFGNNANSLTLLDDNGSLAQGNCVNGLPNNGKVDVFGEYAYCNAPAWFAVANQMIADGMLVVPPLGTYNIPAQAATATTPAIAAKTNVPCASVRDFRVIDQDQSDNMVTSYLLTAAGTTAQDTLKNRLALPTATQIVNASDNRLISVAIAGATGCLAFTAPDLANPGGAKIPALPLNELQAARFQKAPIALVPANDPMAKLAMTTQNLAKVNLYRAGVNQHPANSLAAISGVQYCTLFLQAAPTYILQNQGLFSKPNSSPAPTVANTLFTFMAQRVNGAINAQTLNCQALLNIPNAPFVLTTDAATGVITNATLDPKFTAQLNAAVAAQVAAADAAAAKAAALAAAQAAAAQAKLTAAELAALAQIQADEAKLEAIIANNAAAEQAAEAAAAVAASTAQKAKAAAAAAAAAAAKVTALQNPNASPASVVAAAKAAAAATTQAIAAKTATPAAAPKTTVAATSTASTAKTTTTTTTTAKTNSVALALDAVSDAAQAAAEAVLAELDPTASADTTADDGSDTSVADDLDAASMDPDLAALLAMTQTSYSSATTNSVALQLDDTYDILALDDGADATDSTVDDAGLADPYAVDDASLLYLTASMASPICIASDAPAAASFSVRDFFTGVGSTVGFSAIVAAAAGLVYRNKKQQDEQMHRIVGSV